QVNPAASAVVGAVSAVPEAVDTDWWHPGPVLPALERRGRHFGASGRKSRRTRGSAPKPAALIDTQEWHHEPATRSQDPPLHGTGEGVRATTGGSPRVL